MAATIARPPGRGIHPVHAVLLAAALPLYWGGLFSDIAYAQTYEIQWINFAAWLIAGAMVFTGLTLLWAIIDLVRADRRRGRVLIYVLLLAAIFVLGLLNSLVHAKDAWGTMPEGLALSAIVAVLALLATWVGFASLRGGEAR